MNGKPWHFPSYGQRIASMKDFVDKYKPIETEDGTEQIRELSPYRKYIQFTYHERLTEEQEDYYIEQDAQGKLWTVLEWGKEQKIVQGYSVSFYISGYIVTEESEKDSHYLLLEGDEFIVRESNQILF